MPPELASQWEKAPALLESLGWTFATDAGLEADDVMFSFALAETAAGAHKEDGGETGKGDGAGWALLFVRSFVNLDSYAVGFDPAPLVSANFYMPGQVYDAPQVKARETSQVPADRKSVV